MRLRPYRAKDFPYLQKWIGDTRTHALWCAGSLPFPLTEESFRAILAEKEMAFGGCGYTFTEDDGQPVGFFFFSVNEKDNSGHTSFIVVDSSLRGKGYGTQMLNHLLKYAFTITNVSKVRLNVFDVNERARKCYEKAGFSEESFTPDALMFEGESWGRYLMVAEKESTYERLSICTFQGKTHP